MGVVASVEIEVPFHDVDMMNVCWHGHYIKYFEIARCAVLDKIDYNYVQMSESGYVWPVIDIRVRYAQPLSFQQKFTVNAEIVEWENRLKIEYVITDSISKKRLTKGYSVQVAVAIESQEMQFASPDILLAKLGVTEN